ncbi:MAG: GNAT family N-acetyltransferase [Asgard group archaeon]|nr:GNAT family N-acetyltransferase [Asgard group archaeon]
MVIRRKVTIEDFAKDPVPVIIGKTEAFKIENNIPMTVFYPSGPIRFFEDNWGYYEKGQNQMKVMVCPKCLRAIIIGRDSLREKYHHSSNHSWIRLTNESLFKPLKGPKSMKEYYDHLDRCKRVFRSCWHVPVGYYVETKKQKEVAENLGYYSMISQCLSSNPVTREGLERGEIVLLHSNDDCPEGYVAFYPVSFSENETIINTYALWDMFTFQNFRRKGIATKLLKQGLRGLDINRDYFVVKTPISHKAASIIIQQGFESIILKYGERYQRITMNKFRNYL